MYIPIIYYHSVAPRRNPDWIKGYLTLELRFFEAQMKYLYNNGYKTIFLDDYFDILSGMGPKNGKYVCITFDDGFLDNWVYAFPILEKYKFKATIFISPEFVDLKAHVRKTLKDYWSGKATMEEIEKWGYLTWEEMNLMEASGMIDIQSHTMSHAELFISDKIVDFHRPKAQYLYPVGNKFPERKPYYIEDREFEKLLPYGYPFFEFKSAVIARKVEINPEFIDEVVLSLQGYEWNDSYSFSDAFKLIDKLYRDYKKRDQIISNRESQKEFDERLEYELKVSKDIIEEKLNKDVKYLCWPNHDYSEYTHMKAREFGYRASVIVLSEKMKRPKDRFDRISIASFRENSVFSQIKSKIKLNGYHVTFPMSYFYQLIKREKKGY